MGGDGPWGADSLWALAGGARAGALACPVMGGPPEALVRSLTTGSGGLSGLEWHDEVSSTNDAAAAAARRGVPEIHLVLADRQTRGRGRRGRPWLAPQGSSLLGTFVVRPPAGIAPAVLGTLPLLAGVALAEVVGAHLAPAAAAGAAPEAALKWPNDLVVRRRPDERWRKAAGILTEREGDAVLVGVGCNVDWREMDRPAELAEATALGEVAGVPVDRWRVLAGLVGVFARRYAAWCTDPAATVADYRARCVTIGARVRVEQGSGSEAAGEALEGEALDVADDGLLEVATASGVSRFAAGDVVHLRERPSRA